MTVLHTSAQVIDRLRVRYSAPAYAFFTEVPNGTGGSKTRTIDALAMGLWPSRGIDIHGIEVKVDRRDWLRELKDPAKADTLARHCDHFWLAVGDADIVKSGELPPMWGLLVPHSNGMRVAVEASNLWAMHDDAEKDLRPITIKRHFVAAILRRADQMMKEEHSRGIREENERAAAAGPRPTFESNHAKALLEELDALKLSLQEFEKRSGIHIDQYSGARIGRAVALIQRIMHKNPSYLLSGMRRAAEHTIKEIDEQVDVMAEVEKMMNGDGT